MKKSSLFLILLLAAFLIPCCHKGKLPNVLPPVTQEGKNTIGFKINGKVWIPERNRVPFGNRCPEVYVKYSDEMDGGVGSLIISVSRKENNNVAYLHIGAIQNTILDTGQYFRKIMVDYSDGGAYVSGSYSGPIYSEGGYFSITKLDTINQIISSKFAFSLKSNNTGKMIRITDGRFDFHYNVCR